MIPIALILRLAHKPERRRTSCAAHGVAERVVKLTVRHRLRTVRDAPCASQRIGMLELARGSSSFRQSRRVESVAINTPRWHHIFLVGVSSFRNESSSGLQ